MTNNHDTLIVPSVWILTVIGFAAQLIPVLQIISLALAIAASIFSIIKNKKK